MGSPGRPERVTLQDTLHVFTERNHGGEPLTTAEVAEPLNCARRTAYSKLQSLVETDRLRTKKVGARARVWWQPTPEDGSQDVDHRQSTRDEFGEFVRAVEEYAIFTLDTEGCVASWNDGAERIKGYDEDEILGEHFSIFYPEGDVEQGVPARNLAAAEELGRLEDEGWRIRQDGSEFWATVNITAIRDDNGELQGFTKVTRDLTDQKRREDQLRRERDLTDQILEASPVGIMILDTEGEVEDLNGRAKEILDISDDEVETYSPADRVVDDEDGRSIPVEEHPFARALATGEPVYDQVLQVGGAEGERRWLSISAEPVRSEDGAVERVVTTGDDVTELKERERQLRREREQTADLLETAPVAISIQDADGNIVMANRQAEAALGLSERALIDGSEDLDEWHIVDAEGAPFELDEAPSARVRSTGEPVSDEVIGIEPPDGDRKWFSVNATPVFDRNGELDRIITAGEDITVLKEQARLLERQRDELEAELQEVYERVDDAFYALDEDWRFTHVNRRAEEILGRSEGELLGKSVWDVFPEAAGGDVWQRYHQAVETQKSVTFEVYFETLDIWTEVNAYPSESGLSVYFRDVTERVERNRELERYEQIVETVQDGVYTVDSDGRFTMVNEAYAEMTGYPREELLGEHVSMVVDEETIETARGIEAEMAEGDRKMARFEADISAADDRTVRAEATFSLLPGDDEDYERVGVVRDVTERVDRERELERTLDLLERTEHIADVGGWEIEPATTEVFWTEHLFDLLEFPDDEEPPLDGALDVYHPEDRPLVEEAVGAAVDAGEPFDVEARFLTADGEERWLRVQGVPETVDGEVVSLRGAAQDITGRKERERELVQYETVFDTVDDGIYILDDEFCFVEVNLALAELTGYTSEELLGEHYSFVVGANDSDRAAELHRELATGGRDQATLEADLVTKSGDRIPGESNFSTLPSGDDGFQGAVGVLRDLSDRMAYERELQRYETLIEESADVNAVLDPDGTLQFVTSSVEHTLGYAAGDLEGENVFEYIHPDDHDGTRRAFEGLVDMTGDRSMIEFRFRHADGSWVWLESRGRNLLDDPKIEGLVVYTRDVTDRKAYEQELKQYETLIEESTDVNAILDPDGTFRYLTPSVEHVLGYGADELQGEVGFDYIHPEDRDVALEEFARMVEEPDYRPTVELRFEHADGTWVVMEVRGRNLLEDSLIEGVVAYTRDVTERKQYETWLASLNELNELFQRTLEDLIESDSREAIEQAVCDRMVESDLYEYAWIGEFNAEFESLDPLADAWSAPTGSVEMASAVDGGIETGPSVEAAKRSETRVEQALGSTTGDANWRAFAAENGFESIVAIPIRHNDAFYGVLTLYTARPKAFDDHERAIIARFGDAIGHAIAAVERKHALTTDEVFEVEFHLERLPGGSMDLGEGDRISFDRAVPIGDGSFVSYGTVTAGAYDALRDLADRNFEIETVGIYNDEAAESRFEARLVEGSLVSIAAARNGQLTQATIEQGSFRFTVRLPPSGDIRALFQAIQERYPEIDLVAQRRASRDNQPEQLSPSEIMRDLTDRQRSALEAAFSAGYFEWPRDRTGEEIAETMAISPSTLHQHLRAGERKLLGVVFVEE